MKSCFTHLLCCAALSLSQLGIFCCCANSQDASTSQVSEQHRVQGYYQDGATTVFVFDQGLYNPGRGNAGRGNAGRGNAGRGNVGSPRRVVVTGEFRGWDQDMDDPQWQLRPTSSQSGIWLLPVPNSQYRVIPPSSAFKYRIDDGQWLEPPTDAPNREAGNLVFAADVTPEQLRAEVRGATTIWFSLTGEGVVRSLDEDQYRFTSADGTEIGIKEIIPQTAHESLLIPKTAIDPSRVYYLELPGRNLRALCRRDGWFRELYSDKALGAEIAADGQSTSFRIFAPRATSVRLFLYRNSDDSVDEARVVKMIRDDVGVWEAVEEGDLHGTYYDYTVHGPDDPGNYFYETHPVHVSDPYARISVDSFGKCRVARAIRPASPLASGRPAMEDVIAYEVHVQDFTDLLPVDEQRTGTFPAMVERGLRNQQGESIGFDYLVNLGINVVHLMPVQEYLHYPDDQWQAAFEDDRFMIANGINRENYQWGYRTTHAFAVETRYRERGTDHGAQREQFRDLVQAFHDHEIAVIIDLVPNHTGENMDGRHLLFNFNVIDLPYYYRTDETLSHIGPFGNEVKTEMRPMVQRWLIDQCRSLIGEFGIDGFRIDLAGQIDEQTLLKLRHELGDDVIIYGEPWIAPSDPEVARHPDWGWYKEDAPITYFQDAARNAFKGPTSNPQNKAADRGFAGGDANARGDAMRGLLNSFDDEVLPNRGINYLDIHDNWALADRFATQDWDGRSGVDEGPFKIAAGLLLTSLGPVVLHGGSEFMRSKGAAELKERALSFGDGKLHFHGKSDTYNQRIANRFVWENIGKSQETGSACDYRGVLAWWKGMIQFRRSSAGEPFRIGTEPADDYYRWILPDNQHLLGYVVSNKILVLINTSGGEASFQDVALPSGNWRLIADANRVDHVRGIDGDDGELGGGRAHDLLVPSTSMKIWLRQ